MKRQSRPQEQGNSKQLESAYPHSGTQLCSTQVGFVKPIIANALTKIVQTRQRKTKSPAGGGTGWALGNEGALTFGAGYETACWQQFATAFRKPREVRVAPDTVSMSTVWALITAGISVCSMAAWPT